jgi:cytochrome c oxidase assembly protein subunit 15
LLVIQLIYGAFMAGLKAAPYAPTWPSINGEWWPSQVHSLGGRRFNGLSFLVDNPLVIHFIHRNLAYLVFILIAGWWWSARRQSGTFLFRRTRVLPLVIVLLQVILGIFTVLNAVNSRSFLWLGVAHQFVAMLLLLSLLWIVYIIRGKPVHTR